LDLRSGLAAVFQFLANLVMSVFMGLAAIVRVLIMEDFKRFASDKVVRGVIVYNAPDTFLETPVPQQGLQP
jgi:hypothetical protein